MKWLPKLMGFDYEVKYKKGVENAAVDALSRVQDNGLLMTAMVVTMPTDLSARITDSWEQDVTLKQLLLELKTGSCTKKHYTWSNNQLFRKNKLVVGNDIQLRMDLLAHFHGSSIGDHSGVKVTTHKMSSVLYWKGMRKEIKKYVRECITCQRCKPDLSAYPGLLQPLPIPNRIWESISMDFIEGLPKSQGYNVIFVVVDRLTKYAHFMPLTHPFSASQVAQVFLDTVYKLHGLPLTIVSDRDKVFLSKFWAELFKMLQVKLLKSTAYHPQTDGQTEVVNRCLEGYLRCMTGEKPKEWVKWLSLAELWYNSNFHTSILTTPFDAVYGQSPLVHVPYLGGLSKVDAVDKTI